MRFVFLGVPAEKETEKNSYQAIIEAIVLHGHTINDTFVKAPSKRKKTNPTKNNKRTFTQIALEIKKSDAVIVEGTKANLDIGRFLATSLQYHKPILILYREEIPEMLDDDSHSLLFHKQYTPSNRKDLEHILTDFFKKVDKKKLLYRFNLMLSKEMNSFLMDKAKENNISKADYIRQLLDKKMDKTEYQENNKEN